ncbi:unnamed protein product [Amoebophrya sp. A120]|nr:unnamed protein product [Amoebophrya sp. A120]|eukprot:GSA120T00010554001.1
MSSTLASCTIWRATHNSIRRVTTKMRLFEARPSQEVEFLHDRSYSLQAEAAPGSGTITARRSTPTDLLDKRAGSMISSRDD